MILLQRLNIKRQKHIMELVDQLTDVMGQCIVDESQYSENGEVKYKSAWTDDDLEAIRLKILILIRDL